MEYRTPYPEIEPNRIGILKVSDLHELYFEESGSPDGKPVLFVHGGPGAGTKPDHRRTFDPVTASSCSTSAGAGRARRTGRWRTTRPSI